MELQLTQVKSLGWIEAETTDLDYVIPLRIYGDGCEAMRRLSQQAELKQRIYKLTRFLSGEPDRNQGKQKFGVALPDLSCLRKDCNIGHQGHEAQLPWQKSHGHTKFAVMWFM